MKTSYLNIRINPTVCKRPVVQGNSSPVAMTEFTSSNRIQIILVSVSERASLYKSAGIPEGHPFKEKRILVQEHVKFGQTERKSRRRTYENHQSSYRSYSL